jgi:microcompartment protein CcmL/EutN
MDALYNRIPTMPEAYLIEIEQGGEGISQLEILEGNVAACQHALDMAVNDAKRLYGYFLF